MIAPPPTCTCLAVAGGLACSRDHWVEPQTMWEEPDQTVLLVQLLINPY